MEKQNRAPIRATPEPYLTSTHTHLSKLLDILQAPNPQWYVSVLLERRGEKIFTRNQRGQASSENIRQGVVLRIYDGFTLYEQATDSLEKSHLENQASDLVKRIPQNPTGKPKYYKAPTWKERLEEEGAFEPELLSQIPPNPQPDTHVHFGTPSQEMLWTEDAQAMTYVEKYLQEIQEYAKKLPPNHPCKNVDFSLASLALSKEDYFFMDAQVNLSQSLLRNRVTGMAMKKGERGYCVDGGLGGRETVHFDPESLEEIYFMLEKQLGAKPLKAGRYKLLMGPDIAGVFAHEAFGHSQEGDTCARGRSKAWELYHSKESVGNALATILNNPAIYKNADQGFGAWGSYYFDEEGWLAKKQYLVKGGVLQSPMTNLTSAIRLSVPRTANGKRECWSHGVYTRQTNTYFSEGTHTLDELLKAVDYGFLAHHPAGGMEDPKGMGIQVGIAYLEEIKDGKLTGQVFHGPSGGSVQMTGYTPDYLNSILMKSKIEADKVEQDTCHHPLNKVGGCGKYHKELVQAGSGGPYMLVDNVLLG